MHTGQPTILIIIGVTGDLSRRKLLPAVEKLAAAGVLPEATKVIGVSRRAIDVGSLVSGGSFLNTNFIPHAMDLTSPSDYQQLKALLQKLSIDLGGKAQRIFYLSVPPSVTSGIIRLLGQSGIAGEPHTKLLLEKPFGTDLLSAQELVEETHMHFDEQQLYRIDHYLAKEMTQNLLVFRSGNSLFKRTWNGRHVDRIEILVSEKIGIEGRAGFYESTGALRDVIQSHALQLAALTLMELPKAENWGEVPGLRLRALRQLRPVPASEVAARVVRGQYDGYRLEAQNPGSVVETFVSLKLFSADPTWEGVPIILTAGKALSKQTTEIRLHYSRQDAGESNRLTIRIQPNEGVEIDVWTKRPGFDRGIQKIPLRFSYAEHFTSLPDAYERVLLDAIRTDRSLFALSDEVLASWRLLAHVQDSWNRDDAGIVTYRTGTEPEKIAPALRADEGY